MTDTELIQSIERLRRAQPRNVDTLAVCEALQAEIVARRAATTPTVLRRKRAPKGTFDRNAYQRELMRKRRAEGKA